MRVLPVLGLLITLAGGCASGPTATPPPAPPRMSFRVEVTGHGPPMILIPGLASSGETWTTTVEHLRARYTCHVLTLPGFVGVPPIRGPLLPAVKAELASYIAAQQLTRPVIVGHSLGGDLALDLAADHPELVGPLVIVDSLPFFGAIAGAKSVEDARPVIEQIRAVMGSQTPEQYEAYVRANPMTKGMVTAPADQQRLIGWSLASDRATVTGALLELFGTDLRPRLAGIATPVLVIAAGIESRDLPGARASLVETFRNQYAALPHLHFVVSDTARHFVMFDDLPWFVAQLDDFLGDPDAAVRDRGFPPG